MNLSAEEQASIEPIFRYLLFDNYGVFVLFGSKPMCDALLPPQLSYEETQKLLEEMPENVRQQVDILETNIDLKQAWENWQKIQQRFHIKKYILIKISDSIYLVSIPKAVEILNENYPFFKELLGTEFSPEEIVDQMKDSQSIFWKKILHNHTAMGLLYGYGDANIKIFKQNLSLGIKPIFSTDERIDIFNANPQNFSIPIFASYDNDPLVQCYISEKQKILDLYKDKDMMTVSLKALSQ